MLQKLSSTALPLLAAFIWGIAFVAQKGNTIGTLTFNAIRSLVAFLLLLAAVAVIETIRNRKAKISSTLNDPNASATLPVTPHPSNATQTNPNNSSHQSALGSHAHTLRLLRGNTPEETRALWIGGICCGTMLALATFFQQAGLDANTEAGKAGFLTAMYIVLVPVFGLVLKKKVTPVVWLAVALAVVGLYLLCVKDAFTIRASDALVLTCSVVFAIQILLVDHFSPLCNGVKLSCIQFLTCFVVSAVPALIFEETTLSDIQGSVIPILYLGVLSSGVAYTLQIIAQRNANPAVVSLLMSMESVFSVLAGAALLGEVLSVREYVGCALMTCAIVLTQLPTRSQRTTQTSIETTSSEKVSVEKTSTKKTPTEKA